ncbi:hypothetical protein BDW67DRAFT_164126 [Aspergillus spinulosporus]
MIVSRTATTRVTSPPSPPHAASTLGEINFFGEDDEGQVAGVATVHRQILRRRDEPTTHTPVLEMVLYGVVHPSGGRMMGTHCSWE